jgi:hypothetical protein
MLMPHQKETTVLAANQWQLAAHVSQVLSLYCVHDHHNHVLDAHLMSTVAYTCISSHSSSTADLAGNNAVLCKQLA